MAGSSGVYNPLAPARILDTRDGTGGIAGARAANSTNLFTLAGTHVVVDVAGWCAT